MRYGHYAIKKKKSKGKKERRGMGGRSVRREECSTLFRFDPIGGSELVLGCSFNSFCLLFICFFFVKVSRPESLARPEGRIRTGALFTPTVFIYLIKTFYLCHFVLGFSITRKHFQMVGP